MFDFDYTPETFEALTVCSGTAPLTTARRNLDMADDTLPTDAWAVYRITCLVTKKPYIGITSKTAAVRWHAHIKKSQTKGNISAIAQAIRTHGKAAFVVETLYVATSEREAVAVERGLIAEYGTMVPTGYNLTTGGETYDRTRLVSISEKHLAHLRRLAAVMKGKKRSPESIEKYRQSRKGMPMSEAQKLAFSIAKKGKKSNWSEDGKARILAAAKTKRSDTFKRAISERNRARWANPEFKERMHAHLLNMNEIQRQSGWAARKNRDV